MVFTRAATSVVVAICATTLIASSVHVPCPAGTRVYSLSVWSGKWLDGMYMRCTGDSDEQAIPTEFNENPGGDKYDGICAGTAGVQSIAWDIPTTSDGRIVHGNVTCLNSTTHFFAETDPYDKLAINASVSVSCQEGEYVHGLRYDIEYQEDGDYPYFLTYVGFLCSTAALDPICTACSGGATLLSGEDQPEYCVSPTCTSDECCEIIREASDSATVAALTTIAIGLAISTIASIAALAFKIFAKQTQCAEGILGANVDEGNTWTTNAVANAEGNDASVNVVNGGHEEESWLSSWWSNTQLWVLSNINYAHE